MSQPEPTKADPKDMNVTTFHHTLVWPLLLVGPGNNADTEAIEPFIAALTEAGWIETAATDCTRVEDDHDYDEIVYFHPFVRDFLFGDGETPQRDRLLRRLKRADIKSIKVGLSAGEEVTLDVKRAEIRLIRPRVLILVLELARPADVRLRFDQVLDLQNRLRRVFPPFFENEAFQGEALASFQWGGLATPTGLKLDSTREEFTKPVLVGSEPPIYAHWQALFGPVLKPLSSAKDRHTRDGLFLQQIVDDRMPAMSYIAVDQPELLSEDLLDNLPAFDSAGFDYDPEFRARLRDGLRYTRFRHWGTTYFCNGTSFTVLTSTKAPPYLLKHFQRHYLHLGVIAHYQHSALLYFQDQFAERCREMAGVKNDEEFLDPTWRKKVRVLLQRFLKFRTRSYFTEVSNQIQGKDLFALWTTQLGTAKLFESVADTCDHLYQALEAFEERQLVAKAEWGLGLTILLGGIGVVAALGSLVPEWEKFDHLYLWLRFGLATGLGSILGGLAWWLFWKRSR